MDAPISIRNLAEIRRALSIFLVFLFALDIRATTLGIKGRSFLVEGKPKFLLGISYYGALGAPREFIRKDLDDMKRFSFNWLRVWATWNAYGEDVSAVDKEGNPREPYFRKLEWIVKECDKRGLIVDITMNGGTFSNHQAHLKAVREIVTALKSYRNWYIDLANEHDVRDARFVSFSDLKELRNAVKEIDPNRLVTASGTPSDEETLKKYLYDVKVDFIAPHLARNPQAPKRTEEITKRYYEWMEKLGRVVPVHYQEPFRRGYTPGWEPKAEDFLVDLEGAKRGGAAGWCFHNGSQRNCPDEKPRRSFDMREKRLFEQLDEEERKFLNLLKIGK
jgi:endo-1,4-beta-mannosidase